MDACNATTLIQGWLNEADHMERAATFITDAFGNVDSDTTDLLSEFLQDHMRDDFPSYALDMLYEAIESVDLASLAEWITTDDEEDEEDEED
jgi:hypothetical protein